MKRRVRERQTYEVTLDALNAALCRETWIEHWGSEAEAARAWSSLKDRIPGSPYGATVEDLFSDDPRETP